MSFPSGYQMWADYQDEAPEDLANRLRAKQIDVLDEIRAELNDLNYNLNALVHFVKENTNV